MTPRARWIALLVLLLLALLAFAGARIEWETLEIDTGFSEAATRNPWLAAEQLYQAQGRELRVELGLGRLENLPSTDDVLIITSQRYSLSERRRQALLDWVAAGGNLIVQAHSFYDTERDASDDRLLDAIGVWLVTPEDDDEAAGAGSCPAQYDDEPEAAPTVESLFKKMAAGASTRCEDHPDLTLVHLHGETVPARAAMNSWGVLALDEDLDVASAVNGQGVQLAAVSWGEGRIVVATDLGVWTNRRIGCFDHAYLLWWLGAEDGTTWLLYRESLPSIWQLLWRHAPLLVLSGILLLVLWIAAQGFRQGRPLNPTTTSRRDFSEHLEAGAHYRWRAGVDVLLAELRRQVLVQLGHRLPGFAEQGPGQRVSRAAALLRCSEAELNQALYGRPRGEQALLASIQLLRRIRELP